MALLLRHRTKYYVASEICNTQGDMRIFNQESEVNFFWEVENDFKTDHSETE